LFKKGDELFVSSEYGKRKSTGSLYKMISDKKQVSFKNWTHFGDNRWSDIKIPKKLGINAKRIYHKQTFYERLLASKDMTTSRYNLICMSFISKTLRLSYTQSPQYSVACDFIAPLYVPFVYSVLFDASKRGIERLFFLARDAKILLDIAKVFQKQFPQIQMTYLYVSRKSLYLPSIDAPTFDEISPFFSSFPDVTLLDVLDKLQMTEHLDKFSSYDSLSGKELLENLLKDEKFCSILKQLSNNQRDLCIKYFKQVEMTDSKSAIIDLSGTRKCHVAINKILKAEGYREVFAYYFEVLEERYPGKNYESVFFADRYSFNRLNIVKRPQLVFEQYFSAADHNTTASYVEKGGVVIPVFDNDSISDDKKKEIYNVNKSVCVNYANYYLKFVEKGMSLYYTRAVLSVYTTFYCAPSPYFLKAFANLSLSETLIRTHQVLRRTSIFSIIRNPRKGWFFGNMVYNSIFPKLMEKMLLLLHLYYKLKDRTPGC
jgi:predicted HAD superfamily hydrolase